MVGLQRTARRQKARAASPVAVQDDTRQLPARPRCVTRSETTTARAIMAADVDFSGGGGGGAAVVSLALRFAAGAAVPHLHRRRHARRPLPARAAPRRRARVYYWPRCFSYSASAPCSRARRDGELFGQALRAGTWRFLSYAAGAIIIAIGVHFPSVSSRYRCSIARSAPAVESPWGCRRLCDGPRLRLRLDALHRPRFCAAILAIAGAEETVWRGRSFWRPIRWARRAVSWRGAGDGAVPGLLLALQATLRQGREIVGALCWC